ncbi:MAG: hypothetical protein QOH96_1165 [Blastocatellia bacterium]|nr:hypothetical protein [Blastocatellia bacterium]
MCGLFDGSKGSEQELDHVVPSPKAGPRNVNIVGHALQNMIS